MQKDTTLNLAIKEYLIRFLPKNPIIIEAGAHIGRDTIKLSKLWPEARIYAFEPIPELFMQLYEKTRSNKNISCYQTALGSTNGIITLYQSSGRSSAASSLFEPKAYLEEHPDVSFKEIKVPVVTLDTWAKEQNISYADFMWLDMQGSELAMLKASPKIVATVKAIHTEVNLAERYAHNPLYPEYKKWLEAQGFKLALEDIYKPSWGNALFIRE